MLGRITSVMIKEFIELWRDKWGRFRLIVPPLVQLVLFGYAATFEVYHVSTAVLDLDHTQESRELIARFTSSNRFNIVDAGADPGGGRRDDRPQRCRGRPRDPCRASPISCARARQAPLQVLVDGTNSNTALIALGYVNTDRGAILAGLVTDLAARVRGIQGAQLAAFRSPSSSGPGLIPTSTAAGSSCPA